MNRKEFLVRTAVATAAAPLLGGVTPARAALPANAAWLPGTTYGQLGLGSNFYGFDEAWGSPYENLIDSMRGWTPRGAAYSPYNGVAVTADGWPVQDCSTLLSVGSLVLGSVYDVYWQGPALGVTAGSGCVVRQVGDGRAELTVTGTAVGINVKAGTRDVEIVRAGVARGTRWNAQYLAYLSATGTARRFMKNSGAEAVLCRPGLYHVAYTGVAPQTSTTPVTNLVVAAGRVSFDLLVRPWDQGPFLGFNPATTPATDVTIAYDGDPAYRLEAYATTTSLVFIEPAADVWAHRSLRSSRLGNAYQGKGQRGIPIEDMIDLANALYALDPKNDVAAWSIPYGLDDAGLRAALSLWQVGLNPAIQLVVSLGNEIWNRIFLPEHFQRARSQSLGNAAPMYLRYDGQTDWLALRERLNIHDINRIGGIARELWGAGFGTRIRVGYEIQLGLETRTGDALRYLVQTQPRPLNVTDLGLNFYVAPRSAWQTGGTLNASRTPEEIRDELLTQPTVLGLPERLAAMQTVRAMAAAFGMGTYAYESGPHLAMLDDPTHSIGRFYESTAALETMMAVNAAIAGAGVSPNFHFMGAVLPRPYTSRTSGDAMWYASTSLTVLSPKAQALATAQTMPAPAIQARTSLPGTLALASASWRDDIYWSFTSGPRWTTLASGNVTVDGSALPYREIRWGVWVETAGTFAATLYANQTPAADGSQPTVQFLVDEQVLAQGWIGAGAATDAMPMANQPPLRLALTRGWHSLVLRVQVPPGTAFTGHRMEFVAANGSVPLNLRVQRWK